MPGRCHRWDATPYAQLLAKPLPGVLIDRSTIAPLIYT